MQLDVVEGDIAELEVDAIANAANNQLWMGAGVAGAIKRAGGSEIEAEAMAQGPIEVGEAVATSGGSLHASHVIHGAVMGQDLRTNADLVARTTRRVLEVADELGVDRDPADAAPARHARRAARADDLGLGDLLHGRAAAR